MGRLGEHVGRETGGSGQDKLGYCGHEVVRGPDGGVSV